MKSKTSSLPATAAFVLCCALVSASVSRAAQIHQLNESEVNWVKNESVTIFSEAISDSNVKAWVETTLPTQKKLLERASELSSK